MFLDREGKVEDSRLTPQLRSTRHEPRRVLVGRRKDFQCNIEHETGGLSSPKLYVATILPLALTQGLTEDSRLTRARQRECVLGACFDSSFNATSLQIDF